MSEKAIWQCGSPDDHSLQEWHWRNFQCPKAKPSSSLDAKVCEVSRQKFGLYAVYLEGPASEHTAHVVPQQATVNNISSDLAKAVVFLAGRPAHRVTWLRLPIQL